MSKFWLSGDWHLDKKNIKLNDSGFFLPVLIKALESIRELKPAKVILLGDIFHSKDMVSSTLSQLFKKFLLTLAEEDYIDEIVLIVGNHDFSVVTEDTYFHAYWAYKKLDKVTVVDDYYKITDTIGCISYCREKELFLSRKEKMGDVRCLIMHQDIKGFLKGDDYIEDKFYLTTEELDCELIVSGHYHTAQDKIVNGRRYVYCGSFESTNFGESDDDKRVIMLDPDSLELSSHPTYMTFHKTIRINVEDDLPIFPEEELERGVKFRLIIKGTKEDIDLKNIPKAYARKITIAPDFIKSKRKRVELKSTDSMDTTFKKYTESELEKNYKNHDFDMEELLKEGFNIYRKALKKRLG